MLSNHCLRDDKFNVSSPSDTRSRIWDFGARVRDRPNSLARVASLPSSSPALKQYKVGRCERSQMMSRVNHDDDNKTN